MTSKQTNPEQNMQAVSLFYDSKELFQSIHISAKRKREHIALHKLEKLKLPMINDHAIQRFKKVAKTHIQLQSLLGKTISLLVMLTKNMFEGHRLNSL